MRMDRREESRARRRNRVLVAARKLISKGGAQACTMRALAQDAGLAVNTIYGLFGSSRDHIFQALMDEALADFRRILPDSISGDALPSVPVVMETVVEYIIEHESIYRPVFLAEAHASHRDSFGWGEEGGLALVRKALKADVNQGLLRKDIDIKILGEHIYRAVRFRTRRWAAGEIESSEFRARALFAVYLALVAAATDESQDQFRKSLLGVQRMLKKRAQSIRPGSKERRRG